MENDGKKYDCGKVRMDLVPLDVVENIGKVLTYGAQKYSDNSWQNLPDFWKRYKAALLRHLTAIDKGELIDPESGLPHIDHVLCTTTVSFGGSVTRTVFSTITVCFGACVCAGAGVVS